jgi:hypothetical protein
VPVPARASVMTHRSVASRAARALIVLTTGLNEPGCSLAATVQPPISSTGAAAADTTPHHGTSRTVTTVDQEGPSDRPGPARKGSPNGLNRHSRLTGGRSGI